MPDDVHAPTRCVVFVELLELTRDRLEHIASAWHVPFDQKLTDEELASRIADEMCPEKKG